MDTDVNTIIAPFALALSGIAIFISTKDSKKQIVVGKIEEAYKLTTLLYSYYSTSHLFNS
jgi:hypothetical protein